nr:TonB-dependent siderophore receptor [Devosia sp. YR412]
MSGSALGQQATIQPTLLDRLIVEGWEGSAPPTGTIGQTAPAYAGGQAVSGTQLGVLGNVSVFDAPFSVSGYSAKLIRDQQAKTLADVVLNDPTVRNDASPFSERDAFFIRGFSVTNLDTAFDGLFYLANPRRSFMEGIDQVQVLKGPSTLLNGGLGRVGGTINLVPKRAADEPLTRITSTYSSDSQLWTHLDLGRRFGAANELGVRVNGSYRNGNTPYNNNQAEVGVASVALDYRGERLRASLDYNHSTQNINAPTSLFNSAAAGVVIPAAPNGRINLSSPFEYHDSTYNMVASRVEYDVLPNTTIYAAGGASAYHEDFVSSSHQIVNANGNATATLAIQPQQIVGVSGEIGVRSEFETGPIGHKVNISAARSLNQNYRGGFVAASLGLPAAYATNIYTPRYLPDGSVNIAALPRSGNLPLFAELTSTSLAISDTMSLLDDRIQLTLGARYQNFVSQSYNTTPGATFGQRNYFNEDGRWSPAIAMTARVNDNLSVYGNYVEALTEGPSAPRTASNVGQIFPPVVTRQREMGVKYDGGAFGVTAGLFEIEQPNGFNSPGGVFSVSGLQVNRGLELSVFGEPFDGLRLLGGVTFMDAKLAKTLNGTLDGKLVPGVPETAFNLYGEYDIPWLEGLTATGRLVYSGSTFYDQANTQKVADWTRVDVGMRYAIEGPHGKPVEFKANIENLFDNNYWASSARGYLAAGAPRTFKISVSSEF